MEERYKVTYECGNDLYEETIVAPTAFSFEGICDDINYRIDNGQLLCFIKESDRKAVALHPKVFVSIEELGGVKNGMD